MRIFLQYGFMAFLFVACHNASQPTDAPEFSKETLDTISARPATLNAAPTLLETAFIKGTTQKIDDKTLNLYGITIGKLKVANGHIIACDPLHIDEYGTPYTQAFPTGEFPVQLSIARLQDAETIAFARISFSDEPVAKWELALLKEQQPIPVGDKDIHGYGVDGGVGIFIDEAATKTLDQSTVANTNGAVFKELDKHKHNGWRYALYNFGAHNLAVFTTGSGDGRYATYIGYDAKGQPCRLVSDFNIFSWRKQ